MHIVRQRGGPLDQIHQHRGAAFGYERQQLLDPEQRDLLHHLLGVGGEAARQLEAAAGVVDLVRPVAAGGPHHGPHVLRRLGIDQPDAAISGPGMLR
ncbi:hypothetical protein D3C85_1186040 [compost metagenome]